MRFSMSTRSVAPRILLKRRALDEIAEHRLQIAQPVEERSDLPVSGPCMAYSRLNGGGRLSLVVSLGVAPAARFGSVPRRRALLRTAPSTVRVPNDLPLPASSLLLAPHAPRHITALPNYCDGALHDVETC